MGHWSQVRIELTLKWKLLRVHEALREKNWCWAFFCQAVGKRGDRDWVAVAELIRIAFYSFYDRSSTGISHVSLLKYRKTAVLMYIEFNV